MYTMQTFMMQLDGQDESSLEFLGVLGLEETANKGLSLKLNRRTEALNTLALLISLSLPVIFGKAMLWDWVEFEDEPRFQYAAVQSTPRMAAVRFIFGSKKDFKIFLQRKINPTPKISLFVRWFIRPFVTKF